MIAIIDYDAGNLASVFRAVSHLGYACAITKDVKEIQAAQRIIFPGVGAAGAAMESLQHSGLDVVIKEAFAEGKPIFWVFAWVRRLFWRTAKKIPLRAWGY